MAFNTARQLYCLLYNVTKQIHTKKLLTGLITVVATAVVLKGSNLSAVTMTSGSGYNRRLESYAQYTGLT